MEIVARQMLWIAEGMRPSEKMDAIDQEHDEEDLNRPTHSREEFGELAVPPISAQLVLKPRKGAERHERLG